MADESIAPLPSLKQDDDHFERHLFVCVHRRQSGEDCASKGSEALRDQLKKSIKENYPHLKCRVNSAGCLGRCLTGIAVVSYPEARWFTSVNTDRPEDVQEIIKYMGK